MPERNRAAMDVDLPGIQFQFARDGDRLRGNGLVELEEFDVGDGQFGALEHGGWPAPVPCHDPVISSMRRPGSA
jgi:hypothetical protein